MNPVKRMPEEVYFSMAAVLVTCWMLVLALPHTQPETIESEEQHQAGLQGSFSDVLGGLNATFWWRKAVVLNACVFLQG